MAVVVLDACALIAYLRDEDGSERIKEVLLRPEDSVIMHVIPSKGVARVLRSHE